MSGKLLENNWKRLEMEQNGLINFDHSGAYFYPGDLETLSERKFADFGRKNDRRRGFSLITAAGSHRQQQGRQPGTHGGFLWGWRPASVVSK